MATVTRYVNTASTPGGDGTTNATDGGDANRAYASLNEWEAAEQTDLVTDGDIHVVKCSGTAADTTAVNITGWTTGASNYIQIETDSALSNSRHSGKWDTSAYRLELSSGGDVITINEDYIRFYGLQISFGTTSTSNWDCVYQQSGTGVYYFEKCIFKSTSSTGTGGRRGIDVKGAATFYIQNNVFYDLERSGSTAALVMAGSATAVYFQHNTVNNCLYSIFSHLGSYDLGVVRAKNNLVTNEITAAFDTSDTYHADSDYNIVSDATTAPGANSTHNAVITYAGAADFHTTDSDATISGHNLYSDADYACTEDIDEDARASTGNVYAGADAIIVAAGGVISPGFNRETMGSSGFGGFI